MNDLSYYQAAMDAFEAVARFDQAVAPGLQVRDFTNPAGYSPMTAKMTQYPASAIRMIAEALADYGPQLVAKRLNGAIELV